MKECNAVENIASNKYEVSYFELKTSHDFF